MINFAETAGKPVFVDLPKMKSLQFSARRVGEKIQFYCTAEGEMPIQYKWLKDGKPLRITNVSKRMNPSQPVLKLNDLVFADIGNYTCMAWNKFGMIKYEFMLYVRGEYKTMFCPVHLQGLVIGIQT